MKKHYIYLLIPILFLQCNFTQTEISTKQNSKGKSLPTEPIYIFDIEKIKDLPLKPIHLENSEEECKFTFSTQCFSVTSIDKINGEIYYVTKSDETNGLISYYNENAKVIKSHEYGNPAYSTTHDGNSLLYKGYYYMIYDFEKNEIIDSIITVDGYHFEKILSKMDTAQMYYSDIQEIELIKQKFPEIESLNVLLEDDYEKKFPDKSYSDYLEEKYIAFLKKYINKDVYSLDDEIIFPKKGISVSLNHMPFKLPEYATDNKKPNPKLNPKILLEERETEKKLSLKSVSKYAGSITKPVYCYDLIYKTDTIRLKNENRIFMQNVSENENSFILVLQINDRYSFFEYDKN